MICRGCDRGARRCTVAGGQSTMMVAQKQPNHMLAYTPYSAVCPLNSCRLMVKWTRRLPWRTTTEPLRRVSAIHGVPDVWVELPSVGPDLTSRNLTCWLLPDHTVPYCPVVTYRALLRPWVASRRSLRRECAYRSSQSVGSSAVASMLWSTRWYSMPQLSSS